MGCGTSTSKGGAADGPTPKTTTAGSTAQVTTQKPSEVTTTTNGTSSDGTSQAESSTPQKKQCGQSQQQQPQPQQSQAPQSPQRRRSSNPQTAPPATAAASSAPAAAPASPPVAAPVPGPAAAAPAPEPKNPSPTAVPAPAPAAPAPTSRASSSASGKLPPMPAGSFTKLPPAGAAAGTGSAAPVADSSVRPALQVPKLVAGAALSCLLPSGKPPVGSSSGSPELPPGSLEWIQQLASGGGGAAAQAAAAAHARQLLCAARPPVKALLDAGAAAALVRCLREGPPEAKLDAAWALTNIAASPDFGHVEALCNAEATAALIGALGLGKAPIRGTRSTSGTGMGPLLAAASTAGGSAAAAPPPRPASASAASAGAVTVVSEQALREQALWALANIAGAVNPEYKTQTLAVEVLDLGALGPVMAVLEAEAAAIEKSRSGSSSGSGSGPVRPLLRCAAWCLHNLAKHKNEKEMVDVIPLATRLLLLPGCADAEPLTCLAWVLAYLGANEDNKSHMKQALPALPRLVPWVRAADSPLATPALLCVGTLCTGYMRSLDYSGEVVEAGGVPAFLSYLRKGAAGKRRDMVMNALFALSNVAGANNATVGAMLEAGAFTEVISLLRGLGDDEEARMECLFVLTNAWDPMVGAEVPTVQKMLAAGILEELDGQLVPSAPAARLNLLLKGLADGVKRGQMLMTYNASMLLVQLGKEGAASAPPSTNPVVELYGKLGTVDRITALNSHSDADVATKANGILTVLKFMS